MEDTLSSTHRGKSDHPPFVYKMAVSVRQHPESMHFIYCWSSWYQSICENETLFTFTVFMLLHDFVALGDSTAAN
jgi:hypothetical protein